jgi:ubiquinone/menaquinone biosynthesis C-methylase UbiE
MAALGPAGLEGARERLTAGLSGRVCEVGFGTGLQLPYYPPACRVVGVEPDAGFADRAPQRAEGSAARVELVGGVGEALPFADGVFDAVVFGMVLCSVADVPQVLAEARRVLRPGGDLRCLEHVRGDSWVVAPLLWLTNPLWRLINRQGCNWHRRPAAAIARAGFQLQSVEREPIRRFGIHLLPWRRIRAIAT